MRIVSFLPAATEMACALGLDDQLVGVSHECDYPAHMRWLPIVVRNAVALDGLTAAEIDDAVRQRLHSGASLYEVDEVLLAELAPDLILTQDLCQVCAPSGNEVTRAINALRKEPRIIWFTPRTLADIEGNLRELGEATDSIGCAERLIADGQRRVAAVDEALSAARSHPRVFVIEWIDPIYASGHWIPEMVSRAGGVEVLGKPGAESVRVALHDVAAAAPEVLIVSPCGYGIGDATTQAELLVTLPGWADLEAVRAGRVFAVDANAYFARPGPRVIDGIEILAGLIHPEVFPDSRSLAGRALST